MAKRSQSSRLRRYGKGLAVGLASALGLLIVVGVGTYAAFRLSPWPSALLIRRAFDAGAVEVSEAIAPHLPDTVSSVLDERYSTGDGQRPAQEGDRNAYLDVYFPADLAEGKKLPTVV